MRRALWVRCATCGGSGLLPDVDNTFEPCPTCGEDGQVEIEYEAEYESVRILRLQPGDTIVVRLAGHPTAEMAQAVKDHMQPKFPEHRVLVLGSNVDLEIIRESS